MIKVKDLVKHYGFVKALQGINFEIQFGEIVGLLGPNGAGKTTTMQIITGFLKPTSGDVTVNGHSVFSELEEVQNQIGYLPETAPLYPDLSVQEHLEFAAESHNLTGKAEKEAIEKVINNCGLKEKMYFNISELSKGYRQRVGLAQAIIHDPKILILDEPTTGLDPNQIMEIRKLITDMAKHKTIILSTHIMQEVEAICQRVVMIKNGLIVADDSIKQLKKQQISTHQTRIAAKGDYQEIHDILLKIEGVVKIIRDQKIENSVARMIVASDRDLRSEITKTLVNKGFDILEMNSEEKSMEEVFQELTQ